jgi:hypothetical protein
MFQEKYSIVPQNTKFDEAGMLDKYKSGNIYNAELSSNKIQLTGANSNVLGSEIVIQYTMSFDIGNDLPYLKIWHTIPNERIYADAIINDDSDLNRKKGDENSAMKALAEI